MIPDKFNVKCSNQDHCKEYECDNYGPIPVNHHSIWSPEWCVIKEKFVFPEPASIDDYELSQLVQRSVLINEETVLVEEEF